MPTDDTAKVHEIVESLTLIHEAFVLLDVINAKFHSDPTSVEFFDPSLVERVRTCVELRAIQVAERASRILDGAVSPKPG